MRVNVYVVRAFVKLRELLGPHKKLAQKLAELERQVESHDDHIHFQRKKWGQVLQSNIS
jgi:hypothetical protein